MILIWWSYWAPGLRRGNLGTGTPQEMADGWNICMTEGKSTSQIRRKNVRDKPFKVHYFAVSNETGAVAAMYVGGTTPICIKHYTTFLKLRPTIHPDGLPAACTAMTPHARPTT
jgi:hypothetical protein